LVVNTVIICFITTQNNIITSIDVCDSWHVDNNNNNTVKNTVSKYFLSIFRIRIW